jgi:hypothetical protein
VLGELLDCANEKDVIAARKLVVKNTLKTKGVLRKQRHASAVSGELNLMELVAPPLSEAHREWPMPIAEHVHRKGSTRPDRVERARATIETYNDKRGIERE